MKRSLRRGVGLGPGGLQLRDLMFLSRMEKNYQEPLEVKVAAQGYPESLDPSPRSHSPVFEVPQVHASRFIGFF